MVTFNDADSLVRFIEDKLPPKIYDELFKSKSTWTNKNGTLGESVSTNKPFAVYGKLKELGFSHGVSENKYSNFPDVYVLQWTQLKNFIEQQDSLTTEQKNYSLLTINEACKFLSITRPTLYKLINQGEFPTVQLLTQKRVQLQDLLDYIYRNKT